MKLLVQSISCLLFCLGISLHLNAQCGNDLGNNSQTPGVSSLGQSFKACSMSGGVFKKVSFKRSGKVRDARSGTLKIFRGATKSGTPLYTQSVSLSANAGSPVMVDFNLGGGSGSLSYEPNQTYTFFVELNGQVKPVCNYNDPYKAGRAYANFDAPSSWDLVFEVEVAQGPQQLKVYNAAGQGDALYLSEHLKFVSPGQLTNKDVWQFVEVENGNVVLQCPTRGYLVAGSPIGGNYRLGYHQFQRTATRFKPRAGHQGNSSGYKSYSWVSSDSKKASLFLGIWRDQLVIRGGTGEATSLKLQ